EKADRWLRINRLERVKPPVLLWMIGEPLWNLLPPEEVGLVTEGYFAQSYERDLRRRIFMHRHVSEDRVVTTRIPVPLVMTNSGWGVEADKTLSGVAGGACRYNTVLETEADLERIRLPRLTVDHKARERDFVAAQDLFGDILSVERTITWGNGYGLAPMDTLAEWRGIERLFLDLVEQPEFVHAAMRRLVDGHIGMLEQLEQMGELRLNNTPQDPVSNACSLGHTDALPAPGFDPGRVRPRDLWAQCAAQVFSEVSPDMHEEFCLQHEKRFLDRFGLVCYGCCEQLHKKVGILGRNLPNLRRITMSPWADIDEAAEAIGGRYVFSWKPNPAIIAGPTWDPGAARRQIRDFLRRTRGCVVEIMLNDIVTCGGDPRRMLEWAAVAKEEVEASG
ncbi:hypothetical protein HQ590_06075, partial [bacterium]|nr:hypothetical protein [bacterium]